MSGEGRTGSRPSADGGGLVGFKSHLRPTVVPGDAAYLVSPRGVTALHGSHVETLVPLLDGTRSPGAVLQDAAAVLGPEAAGASLRILLDSGLLRLRPGRPAPESGPDPAAEAYWDLAGLDGGRAAAAVTGATVRIEALDGLDPGPVAAACRDSGIAVVDDGERDCATTGRPGAPGGSPADFSVVLCADYLSPRLADVDAAHRAAGRPWLIAKPCGTDPWVGPVFRPGDGPCWACMGARIRGHRRAEGPVRRALGLADGPLARPLASLAAGRTVAVQLAVLETAKWLAGIRHPAQGAVRTFDTLLLRAGSHPVPRLPHCAVCGDPGLVAWRVRAPFVPVSRPKAARTRDLGGHRALTPEQMLSRYGHLVDPVTGIVKEIRRAPHSPDFTSCFLSGHNLAMGSPTLDGLRAGLRALSGGKGLTDAEARTSALCEAVERYSGTRHGDEPVIRARYRALGAAAVHPNACQLYDERQFRDRDAWNARHSRFQYVPAPFDEDRPTDWTPVWSLTAGTQRLLPTSTLYYSHADSRTGPPSDGLLADSNGTAAGSSPEDALLQGFLELVERDAVALWWYNRTRHPAVNLPAFADPGLDRLREGYLRLGRELWVLDLTTDLGIPVMAALSRRTDRATHGTQAAHGRRAMPAPPAAQDIVFGFGAHFDPRLALRRALTEMGQLLPAVHGKTERKTAGTGGADAAGGGAAYATDDPEACAWWQHATTANQPYLLPDPHVPARGPGDWPYTPRADLLDDVTAVIDLTRRHGMELLVLDQTRPDTGIPVIRVIVPGLRHFWARFAPGRLFDVPVSLGRTSRPTAYEDLNPVPLFV
ncbi:TOMM precursor leader peptide-binding protein [Streptomyces hiroshimensis]|uniref:YcaO domain-containing protein n=1 Tax=Streptomyces hiroshimensis TaxID=66424 RepID=A0ABQ2YYE5_9ACTN|nr:TOMM precursor leader peptide-binding protein [Streptomyces hiroshimensis]GGX96640.1 hypothetical protein GCM10010324_48290 [Streptomyces hiroshimensis]